MIRLLLVPTYWVTRSGSCRIEARPTIEILGKLDTKTLFGLKSPKVSKKTKLVERDRTEEGGKPEGCEWPSGASAILASPCYVLHLQCLTRFSREHLMAPSSSDVNKLDDERWG